MPTDLTDRNKTVYLTMVQLLVIYWKCWWEKLNSSHKKAFTTAVHVYSVFGLLTHFSFFCHLSPFCPLLYCSPLICPFSLPTDPIEHRQFQIPLFAIVFTHFGMIHRWLPRCFTVRQISQTYDTTSVVTLSDCIMGNGDWGMGNSYGGTL